MLRNKITLSRLGWLVGVAVAAAGSFYAMEVGPAKATTVVKAAVLYPDLDDTDENALDALPNPENDFIVDVPTVAQELEDSLAITRTQVRGFTGGSTTCQGTNLLNFYFHNGTTAVSGGKTSHGMRFYENSSINAGLVAKTGWDDLGRCHVHWDPVDGRIDTTCSDGGTRDCNATLVVFSSTDYL